MPSLFPRGENDGDGTSLFFTMPRTVGTHLPHWGTQPRWRNTPAGDEIPVSIATETCFSVKALQMQTYTVPSPGRFFFIEPFVRNGRVGRWPFVPNAFVSSPKPAASCVQLLLQLGHGRRVWRAHVRRFGDAARAARPAPPSARSLGGCRGPSHQSANR